MSFVQLEDDLRKANGRIIALEAENCRLREQIQQLYERNQVIAWF